MKGTRSAAVLVTLSACFFRASSLSTFVRRFMTSSRPLRQLRPQGFFSPACLVPHVCTSLDLVRSGGMQSSDRSSPEQHAVSSFPWHRAAPPPVLLPCSFCRSLSDE